MATKKKSKIIESADIAEMVNKSNGEWPKISQGTHLTVKTYENGHTELIWDDEALTRDVVNAVASIKSKKKKTSAT
jgi:hypothetical protein